MRFHRVPRTLGILAGAGCLLASGLAQASNSDPPISPTVLAESMDDTSLTIIWQKPTNYSSVTSYKVYNSSGTNVCTAGTNPNGGPNLYCHVTGLTANTAYTLSVASEESGGESTRVAASGVTTKAAMTNVYLDTQSGVSQNTDSTSVTAAIQTALNNNCVSGKRVVIKSGESYISGALTLPSNCTFEVDGTLTASTNAAQFQHVNNRFPLYGTGGNYGSVHYPTNYNALINVCGAGSTSCTGSNVRLVGSGTISGGQYQSGTLTQLANNQVAAQGANDSARGDLINFQGVTGLYIRGLTFNNPPEHVIWVSRGTNVSVESISSNSYQGSDSSLHNGDGIDLATSTSANVFGSSFNTGDDCINLNAGSNLPGQTEGRPDGSSSSNNLRIFDNTTSHGHGGVVHGSFTAAWIQDVLIEDNYFNGTDIGLRFKTGTNRGGGAKNITARDNKMSNISSAGIEMVGSYPDSTGMASGGVGYFTNITIKNLTGSVKSGAYAIHVTGNPNPRHTGFAFSNINITGSGSKGISIYQTSSSSFTNVTTASGSWVYEKVSTGMTFSGCTPTPTAM